MFLPSIQKEISRYRQAGHFETATGQAVGSAAATTTVITPTFAGNEVSGVSSDVTLTPAETPLTSLESAAVPIATNADSTPVDSPITINAKGSSKIKVTDASGTVIFDRSVRAGESVSLSGVLPLGVVASRANVIQVQIRGQAFDLASVTKNNTARFEVK
jgi:cytoskeleton protein RodZ